VQIVATCIIFAITLTKAGPIFPVIIILLVPIRLLVMNRIWNREVLRYVDAWACREGTPEDDEDRKKGLTAREPEHSLEDIELGSIRQTSITERSEDAERVVKD
jgi:hypothetical protein